MRLLPPQRKPLQPRRKTLQSLLSELQSRLHCAGVSEPALEASILLEHATGLNRTSLLRDIQRAATESEVCTSAELLTRRLSGEPVQYIVGSAWFYGREFHIDRRVLIPRPETELLVGEGLACLADDVDHSKSAAVCDVGTGSGIIAVTLACEHLTCRLTATDVCSGALEVARVNCRRYGIEERVRLVHGNGLRGVSDMFDIVISNLPYIPSVEIERLQTEIRDYEPRIALDGGEDGLGVLRELVVDAARCTVKGGTLLLEVGIDQSPKVIEFMRRTGWWSELRTLVDLAGVERVVIGRRTAF